MTDTPRFGLANLQGERIPLTVIVPVLNRHEGLVRALQSIMAQDVLPETVIVVDDGSEPAIEVPDEVQKALNVTLLRHPRNLGPAAARNTGILAAESKWLSFLDSDDRLLPNTLGARWAFLIQQERGGTASARRIYGCGWQERHVSGHAGMRRIPHASRNPMDFASGCWFSPGSCIMLARNEVLEVSLMDPQLRRLEDFDWFLALALGGFELVVAPLVGVEIARSRHQDPDHVRDAAELIREKWHLQQSSRLLLRRLDAYLDLEIAAANHYARRRGSAFFYLARSLLSVPRLRQHLSPGWHKDMQASAHPASHGDA